MPKIPSYTAATSLSSGDLLYAVIDPAGTPLSRKITVDNLFGAVPASLPIGWTDTLLYRAAADTIWMRRSTNPQSILISNSYTDGSNYERGFARWVSNVFEIGAEYGGSNNFRSVRLKGTASVNISSFGSDRVLFDNVGTTFLAPIKPNAVGTYDIGVSGNPWRDIYLRPSASLTPSANGDLCIEATSNTTLTFKLKGSDATVRSGTITLA